MTPTDENGQRTAEEKPETKPIEIKHLNEINEWVKAINHEFYWCAQLTREHVGILQEHTENIQHNYELIYELRDEIDELKADINALKLLQIIALKNKVVEEDAKQAIRDIKLS